MNVFLIETESNHFANQLFSSWVHKNLPGWNLLRVGSDGDDIIEQVQVALTKNISKVIHLGRPTTGAIIQMTMAFSMAAVSAPSSATTKHSRVCFWRVVSSGLAPERTASSASGTGTVSYDLYLNGQFLETKTLEFTK